MALSNATPTLEFVVFDRDNTEVDWIDPYVSHIPLSFENDRYVVANTVCDYLVRIPEGGRFEIRELKESHT